MYFNPSSIGECEDNVSKALYCLKSKFDESLKSIHPSTISSAVTSIVWGDKNVFWCIVYDLSEAVPTPFLKEK